VVSLHCVRLDLITYTNTFIRISGHTNVLIAGVVPAVLVTLIGGYRYSIHEIHHGLLAAIAGRFVVPHDKAFDPIGLIIYSSLNRVITEALKNRVGKSLNYD
jgi:diacylglycerol diphosphate phosphatase/phosphatidate phosphatase